MNDRSVQPADTLYPVNGSKQRLNTAFQ